MIKYLFFLILALILCTPVSAKECLTISPTKHYPNYQNKELFRVSFDGVSENYLIGFEIENAKVQENNWVNLTDFLKQPYVSITNFGNNKGTLKIIMKNKVSGKTTTSKTYTVINPEDINYIRTRLYDYLSQKPTIPIKMLK